MSSFFVDIFYSGKTIAYCLLSDTLAFATRPVALIVGFAPGGNVPMLQVMVDGGLLPGLVSTISLILIIISLGVLVSCCSRGLAECFMKLGVALYAADGLAQLPILVWPDVRDSALHYRYPMSRTGIYATAVQVTTFVPIVLGCQSRGNTTVLHRLYMLSFAISLRYACLEILVPDAPVGFLLYAIAAILLTFALTPQTFWKLLRDALEKVCMVISSIAAFVYGVLEYILPKIFDFVKAILQHPLVVQVYQAVIVPCWEFLSPWFLPSAMAGIVYSCTMPLLNIDIIGMGLGSFFMVIGRFFCGATAAVSCLTLTVYAASRLYRNSQPDPLKSTLLLMILNGFASVISAPWRLMMSVAKKVTVHILWPLLADVIGPCLGHLGKFAFQCPFLSIPLVLAFNVMLMWYLSSNMNILDPVGSVATDIFASWVRAVQHLQVAILSGNITDSTFAVFLIVIVQSGAFVAISATLSAVRVVRGQRNGDILDLDELNNIALTMDDPRQCGRCGFGPVDHRGCSNLGTHHMEVFVRGGRQSSQYSNACPRCGWFTGSLSDWLEWDGHIQTPRGRAMFRQRVWCEVVVVVRATSKALLVPFGLLALGNHFGLPSSISSFMAFSYLIPWIFENQKLASSLNNPTVYRRVPRSPTNHGTDADCSATSVTPMLPSITESEALKNILAATPTRVFVREGDSCSVCLDCFTVDAVSAVANATSGVEACKALRDLDPPIVALRCGHALHVECAEAAVSAGGARHVRCPLCREPVTLGGDTTAAIFS